MSTISIHLEDAKLLGECESCGGLVPVTLGALGAVEGIDGIVTVNYYASCEKHGRTRSGGTLRIKGVDFLVRLSSVGTK